MNKNLTFIVMVVDKSGSMGLIKQGAIDGFNKFVEAQREVEGEAVATVCLFDDTHTYIADNEPLKEISLLTPENYVTGGSTALNDTLASTINRVSQQLLAMREKDRPGKVIFCVITDGEENSSVEYSASKVKRMVEYRKDQFGWEFVFIGANQDVALTAKHYAFNPEATFSFEASFKGVQAGYDTMSTYVTTVRTSGK